MKLMELLSNVDVVKYACDQQVDVKGLCYDSRKSAPGEAFVAIRGFQTDGHKYIAQAAEKGAALVICSSRCRGYSGASTTAGWQNMPTCGAASGSNP